MKRTAIINAAEKLFLSNGYGNISMDKVANFAKVSKATLYSHFTNKHELFTFVIRNLLEKRYQQIPNIDTITPNNVDELRKQIIKYVDAIFSFYSDEVIVQLYRILISEVTQFPELFDMYFNSLFKGITNKLDNLLVAYTKKHQLNNTNHFIIACQILDLVRGATLWVKLVQNPQKLQLTQNKHNTLMVINNSIDLIINDFINFNIKESH